MIHFFDSLIGRSPWQTFWTTMVLATTASTIATAQFTELVDEWGLTEVAQTLTQNEINAVLPFSKQKLPDGERAAWALLQTLGLNGNEHDIRQAWERHPIHTDLTAPENPEWFTSDKVIVDRFIQLLGKPLEENITSGYNIVPTSLWPSFDKDRTVIYGHNDWKHARQLIALLNAKGLRPKVTPLIKQSAFLFRDDWGEPTMELVRLENGERLVVQNEYDLFIEFDKPADVERFAELVTRYAKKDSEDEPGLIYDSWWQPFYRTLRPTKTGQPLTVMLVTFNGYRANLISLPEEAAGKQDRLSSMSAEWSLETFTIWVNPAFYRWQLGDYK
jgi:hypothetical protein